MHLLVSKLIYVEISVLTWQLESLWYNINCIAVSTKKILCPLGNLISICFHIWFECLPPPPKKNIEQIGNADLWSIMFKMEIYYSKYFSFIKAKAKNSIFRCFMLVKHQSIYKSNFVLFCSEQSLLLYSEWLFHIST